MQTAHNFNAFAHVDYTIFLYIKCRIRVYTKIDDLPLVHVCHGFSIYDHQSKSSFDQSVNLSFKFHFVPDMLEPRPNVDASTMNANR